MGLPKLWLKLEFGQPHEEILTLIIWN